MKEIRGRISELLDAVSQDKPLIAKLVGNEAIRSAAVSQDRDEIRLAVIAYSISKLLGKTYYRRDEEKWNNFILDARNHLRLALEGRLTESLDHLFADIGSFDEGEGRFINKITEKASAKKASSLYAFGLSLGKAAELANASKWQVMRETGPTKVADEDKGELSVHERLRNAMEAL